MCFNFLQGMFRRIANFLMIISLVIKICCCQVIFCQGSHLLAMYWVLLIVLISLPSQRCRPLLLAFCTGFLPSWCFVFDRPLVFDLVLPKSCDIFNVIFSPKLYVFFENQATCVFLVHIFLKVHLFILSFVLVCFMINYKKNQVILIIALLSSFFCMYAHPILDSFFI